MGKSNFRCALVLAAACAFPLAAAADDDVKEAAVGGAIGGAVGAVVGSELGGKNGAVIGAGVGAAAGAAIATKDDDDDHHHHVASPEVVVVPAGSGHFCPPGQAKKGRC